MWAQNKPISQTITNVRQSYICILKWRNMWHWTKLRPLYNWPSISSDTLGWGSKSKKLQVQEIWGSKTRLIRTQARRLTSQTRRITLVIWDPPKYGGKVMPITGTSTFHTLDRDSSTRSLGPNVLLSSNRVTWFWNFFGVGHEDCEATFLSHRVHRGAHWQLPILFYLFFLSKQQVDLGFSTWEKKHNSP